MGNERNFVDGEKIILIIAETTGPCFWMWIPRLYGKRCVATIHGGLGVIRRAKTHLFMVMMPTEGVVIYLEL